jgi:hypothetical protein
MNPNPHIEPKEMTAEDSDLGWLLFAQWADTLETWTAKRHAWEALSLHETAEWQRRAEPMRTIISALQSRLEAAEKERARSINALTAATEQQVNPEWRAAWTHALAIIKGETL